MRSEQLVKDGMQLILNHWGYVPMTVIANEGLVFSARRVGPICRSRWIGSVEQYLTGFEETDSNWEVTYRSVQIGEHDYTTRKSRQLNLLIHADGRLESRWA